MSTKFYLFLYVYRLFISYVFWYFLQNARTYKSFGFISLGKTLHPMMRVQTCRKCRKFEMLYSTCTSAGIGEKKIREERVTLLKVIYSTMRKNVFLFPFSAKQIGDYFCNRQRAANWYISQIHNTHCLITIEKSPSVNYRRCNPIKKNSQHLKCLIIHGAISVHIS